MIYKSADQLIGKTPLLELTHIEEKLNLKAKVITIPANISIVILAIIFFLNFTIFSPINYNIS